MTMTMYHGWVEVEIPLFIPDDDELHAQYAYVHTLNSTGQVPYYNQSPCWLITLHS